MASYSWPALKSCIRRSTSCSFASSKSKPSPAAGKTSSLCWPWMLSLPMDTNSHHELFFPNSRNVSYLWKHMLRILTQLCSRRFFKSRQSTASRTSSMAFWQRRCKVLDSHSNCEPTYFITKSVATTACCFVWTSLSPGLPPRSLLRKAVTRRLSWLLRLLSMAFHNHWRAWVRAEPSSSLTISPSNALFTKAIMDVVNMSMDPMSSSPFGDKASCISLLGAISPCRMLGLFKCSAKRRMVRSHSSSVESAPGRRGRLSMSTRGSALLTRSAIVGKAVAIFSEP
mmetsp:Transcript_1172/g.3440  ORF Transcript_1172/g.3440 Transcript_1172/m.3440 type:complete len:284 (+) Transcript_1172:1452-2303(+)